MRSLSPQITESAELAKMNSVESEIVIDATPEECFAAATGFEVDSLCVYASACARARLREARTLAGTHCTHTPTQDYPKWAGGMKKVNVIKRQGGVCVCVCVCVRVCVCVCACGCV